MFTLLPKLFIFYCLLTVVMFVLQRHLIYHPNTNLLAPSAYGLEVDQHTLPTVDGVALTAWHMPAKEAMPTILHMHGNAGNIGDRHAVYNAFHEEGFGVLALEWRGYGSSTGRPNEKGFYEDAQTAIDWLGKQGVAESDIILYGESIGSGAAVQMATEISAKALVLEAPFTSLWERAAEIYWYLPAKWMVRDRYDNLSKISQVQEPLFIMHNRGDKIVPFHHGQAIYDAANEPKDLLSFNAADHVAFDRPLIAAKLKEFLQLQ